MRVIAGDLKGRRISAVEGVNTRPTTDKIKESMFNIMGQFFAGGRVLDLFAGSGNLGIEALSRGMDYAVFIDVDLSAIKIINENISNLKLQDKTEVYRNDAFKALKVLAKKGLKFDMIFLDPPYGKFDITELLDKIVKSNLLNEDGLIICEYDAKMKTRYDKSTFKLIRCEVYSTIEILILRKEVGM